VLSITARLTLWYLVIFGVIVFGRAVWQYYGFAENERAIIDSDLRNYSEFLLTNASKGPSTLSGQFDSLQAVMGEASPRFRGFRFMLIDRDSVVYERALESSVDQVIDSLQNTFRGLPASQLSTVTARDIEYRVMVSAIPGHAADQREVVITASLEKLNNRLVYLRTIIISTIPVTMLIAGLGGWFLARRALAPVAEIAETAATISSTNLHQRVAVGKSKDELANLAITFNQMIDRLEAARSIQDRFIADASHDLRTPLTIIQAELELLLNRNDHAPEVREALMKMSSEADRLRQLASDLLFLAKADANQLPTAEETIRLDELLVECVSKLKTLAGRKNIALRIVIDEPVEVVCNPPTLQRALINVIENAIKYSPEDGVVVVRMEIGEKAVRVVVSDTGQGIPEEDLPRIFDRFYRSDLARSNSGSGLGLSIVKSVVDAHGGSVAAASTPGIGTSITISLPV
jgi:heavy metal sensor kinase